MSPKDKAHELLSKFTPYAAINVYSHPKRRFGKECALLAVDEIIEVLNKLDDPGNGFIVYWNEVKRELENK